MKTCTKCGIQKPLSEFSKNKTKKDSLSTYCKPCNINYFSKYRAKYPDKIQSNNDKLMSTKKGHAYKRFHARKNHAKVNNIPFTISLDYIISIIVDECPILKIPLSWCVQSKTITDNSPTIDRINPSLGYIPGNVAWISNRANRIKNDGTAEEHLAIYNFISQCATEKS